MQIPKRKPGKFAHIPKDFTITESKEKELQDELKNLQKKQPHAIKEVERLGAMGDFSENAAYQMAKGRLRRINYRMTEIESFLKHANIIAPPKDSDTIQIGHTVVVETNGSEFSFTILGSSETDPSAGIISQHSALGQELLGKKIGDLISIELPSKSIMYKILRFE